MILDRDVFAVRDDDKHARSRIVEAKLSGTFDIELAALTFAVGACLDKRALERRELVEICADALNSFALLLA